MNSDESTKSHSLPNCNLVGKPNNLRSVYNSIVPRDARRKPKFPLKRKIKNRGILFFCELNCISFFVRVSISVCLNMCVIVLVYLLLSYFQRDGGGEGEEEEKKSSLFFLRLASCLHAHHVLIVFSNNKI